MKNIQTIQEAFAEINNVGLGAPPTMTVRRHLEVLVCSGLVPENSATRFRQVHDEAGYSRQGPTQQEIRSVCTELIDKLRAGANNSPEGVRRAREALTKKPPAPTFEGPTADAPLAADRPRNQTPEFEPIDSILEAPSRGTPSGNHKQAHLADPPVVIGPVELNMSRRQRRASIVCMLLFGAIASAALGYAIHDRIAWGLHVFTSHVLNLPFSLGSSEEHLNEARRLAAANPTSLAHWRRYADLAARHDKPAQRVIAMRRLISLEPDSAQLLNELAWLLCTSLDRSIRNPEQALLLAERAYAIAPSEAVTDTLAEAAFHCGHLERAVELAEEAYAKATRNRAYYRDQLERFRAALDDEIR